jgi:mercuric ion transport protein
VFKEFQRSSLTGSLPIVARPRDQRGGSKGRGNRTTQAVSEDFYAIMISNSPNKCLKVGTWGAVVTALCCFTPILVLGLGVVGLGMLTSYLDYLLLPVLGLFIVLAIFGVWQTHVRCK